MAKKIKTLNVTTAVNTVNANQFFPLTDEAGNVTRINLAYLRAALLKDTDLNAIEYDVFIMFHRKSDNFPLMVRPHKWVSYQISGEIADGVVVVTGGKMLVIAPTETQLTWSSAAVAGGGTTTTDRLTAFDDWNGKANTAAQVKHPECNAATYAPGFCNAYSRTNANGKGLTAGKWWLPSMGELMCMYANMTKINYALKLITGATPLEEAWYWSSTEGSATHAWPLGLGNGYAGGWTAKATDQGRVRPVSAFII